jgi:hypothetical protein
MKIPSVISPLVCGSMVLAISVVSATAASSQLVGLWRFNEASGDAALDASGLGNDGVLTVIAGENDIKPERVPGPTGFGGALSFTNNGDDTYPHSMVSIAAADVLKIGKTASDPWTIAAWTFERSDGVGGFGGTYGRLFAQDGGLSLNFNSGANGDAQYYIWHNSVAAWQVGFGTDAAVVPVLDQWAHLALVYDGTQLTLYRNGNLGSQGGAKASLPIAAAIDHGDFGGYHGALQIGTMPNMVNRNWNGRIDDFAMFKGALSETEIQTIMTGDFSAYLGGPPKIVTQPADQPVNQGLDATFRVTASSTLALSYQWRFDGTDIPGATNSSLTVTNAQDRDAGLYTVLVRNALDSTLSLWARLTVLAPLPPRLIGLWRFDEGSGTNAYDTSGLTNHGTLVVDDPSGQLPSWVASRPGFGQALQFNADGVARSFVAVPANDTLKFGMAANDTWAITAWTFEASDGAGGFVSSYGRLFAQNGGYGLNFDSGSTLWNDPQYYIWHDQLMPWQQGFGTTAAVVPILDQWVHLALVYDGRSLTLYRNGNASAQNGARTSLPVNAGLDWAGYGSAMEIGSVDNAPVDHNWNGMIDDFAIFTGTLSEAQIQTVMSGDFSAFRNTVPLLSIRRSSEVVVIAWGAGMLQSTADLAQGWTDQTEAVSPTILPPVAAGRFFRVKR